MPDKKEDDYSPKPGAYYTGGDMSEKCFEKGCERTDTDYIDMTYGPLYDLRSYCPEHMPGAEKRLEESDRESSIIYWKSVAEKHEEDAEEARNKIAELEGGRK